MRRSLDFTSPNQKSQTERFTLVAWQLPWWRPSTGTRTVSQMSQRLQEVAMTRPKNLLELDGVTLSARHGCSFAQAWQTLPTAPAMSMTSNGQKPSTCDVIPVIPNAMQPLHSSLAKAFLVDFLQQTAKFLETRPHTTATSPSEPLPTILTVLWSQSDLKNILFWNDL